MSFPSAFSTGQPCNFLEVRIIFESTQFATGEPGQNAACGFGKANRGFRLRKSDLTVIEHGSPRHIQLKRQLAFFPKKALKATYFLDLLFKSDSNHKQERQSRVAVTFRFPSWVHSIGGC